MVAAKRRATDALSGASVQAERGLAGRGSNRPCRPRRVQSGLNGMRTQGLPDPPSFVGNGANNIDPRPALADAHFSSSSTALFHTTAAPRKICACHFRVGCWCLRTDPTRGAGAALCRRCGGCDASQPEMAASRLEAHHSTRSLNSQYSGSCRSPLTAVCLKTSIVVSVASSKS